LAVQLVVQLVRFQLVNLSGELNSTTFGEFQKTNAASNSDQSFKFNFEFSSEFLIQRKKKKILKSNFCERVPSSSECWFSSGQL